MNWRTRCTKYSPTCPLVFTSWMTYRTVLTTGRDENTSCPVGTECTSSEFRNAPARNAASSSRSEVMGSKNTQTPADDIRSFTTIGVLSVMHCEYCRFLTLAIVQSYYLTNPMFR